MARFKKLLVISSIAAIAMNSIIGAMLVMQPVWFARYSEIPATNRTPPLITGSFIQYTGLGSWNYTMWATEFTNLEAVGIDTLIIQWVHDSATNNTLYQSSIFGFESSVVSPDMKVPWPNDQHFPEVSDVLNVLFNLAELHNMSIHIGLTIAWDFWEDVANSTWIIEEAALNHRLATELLQKYGNLSSFGGFYIPYEMHQASDAAGADGTVYGTFFGSIAAAIRAAEQEVLGNTDKVISTAPYVSPVGWIPHVLDFWNQFLSRAGVDVLMIQDGVGVHRLDTARDVPVNYAVVTEACSTNNVTFWTDLEIFEIEGFIPASFSRVQPQLEIECKYVEKIIVFDIPHYLSLQYSPAAAVLYQAYDAFLTE
nr:DUF4434 domain-containing protein [Candidatus Sigynarchaeota archaeon]